MIAGILKERNGETRVSLTPEVVKQLQQMSVTVWVEQDAGAAAWYNDQAYTEAGAVITSAAEIIAKADIILTLQPPEPNLFPALSGKILVGILQPLYRLAEVEQWAANGITTFSLDAIPRTTRAQSMDVLSSQASIAGYKAVLLAAYTYSRYFPMLMTAAGSIAPAKALILGAGVAGLQAIATARRLGAVVEVFDTRPAVKEEVMSLGAKFVEVEGAADASRAGGYAVEQSESYKQQQQQRIAESITKADIVITTAQIPGKPAPVLISTEMINTMKPGSVIIDLAAATGGNTTLTVNNESKVHNGVTIIGNSNLPAAMPADASKLYAKNVLNFLKLILDKDGQAILRFEDEIVKGACITHGGQIVNDRVKSMLQPA
ncbi:NAD(P) transhydrogenase subunit alpha [Chitinophaga terrae (ex Kim and Jung 2007)]|uniref:NAD(P) transhydrogenase subunit alpha part 1 n=1 Tax=Chitinophaga terrae (ex Kim and Jung 2007) TaxID=408074 RepID=A0A1H4C071_9BACT|nr:Re/Si-specific NAD(P)(+) transhydrogenase subunit alpha [Chitinophaga terrae (ex Kim and Jung 2007)]GEP91949.1 NAD(P) transhydrogenase subunit alpha [Chitinophaga terrae (ex Kim and Jung 2007)]SEA53724.1 NAD(P) transhydrogenase subunit alpha [Chitinophaga terrae (ex Kim and Jung 2007)]